MNVQYAHVPKYTDNLVIINNYYNYAWQVQVRSLERLTPRYLKLETISTAVQGKRWVVLEILKSSIISDAVLTVNFTIRQLGCLAEQLFGSALVQWFREADLFAGQLVWKINISCVLCFMCCILWSKEGIRRYAQVKIPSFLLRWYPGNGVPSSQKSSYNHVAHWLPLAVHGWLSHVQVINAEQDLGLHPTFKTQRSFIYSSIYSWLDR